MSKGTKKSKDSDTRKIKQVYLSEDGSEETEVTTKVIARKTADDEQDKDGAEHKVHEEHHEHHISEGSRTVRIIAVAVAMFFSLLLAMAVGVGLALWDSNRTITELNYIVLAKEMPQAAPSEVITAAEETEEVTEEAPEEAPASEVVEEEPEEEEDYGATISSDTEGLENVAKAGSDDVLETADDSTPATLDPMADYPRDFTTVDESYFTDALFIGDSRLQGFGFWSGLPATYYCATGFQLYKYDTTNVVQTENGKVPIFEAMPYDAFTKIYIKVGLNELGYGTEENFEKTYAQLIAKLREYEPRAVIYVHAILPVTAEKSEKDKAHNNPNIRVRNASLEKFAKSQKAYFLDAGPVLSDDDGNLRPEMTSDGIHLKPEYMKIWREYLCEHAVPVE